MKQCIALLAIFLVCQPAQASTRKRGEAVELNLSTAYLLYRADRREGPGKFEYVLAKEIGAVPGNKRYASPPNFDPNASLFHSETKHAVLDEDGQRYYVLAVPPGHYVFVAVTDSRVKTIGTCLCMGTLRFEARAGMVNDLGFLLGAIEDNPTQLPELSPYTGSPSWTHTAPMLTLMSVRPATVGMAVPTVLRSLPLFPVAYRAAAKFPNYFQTLINRIPPVPGILAYDGDRAVDLRSEPE